MIPHRTESYSTDRDLQCQGRDHVPIGTLGKYPFKVEHCLYVCIYALHSFSSWNEECGLVTCWNTCTVKPRLHDLMAYFHCQSRIRIPTQTDSCTMQNFSTGFRFGSWSPDWIVCNWDGDPSLNGCSIITRWYGFWHSRPKLSHVNCLNQQNMAIQASDWPMQLACFVEWG